MYILNKTNERFSVFVHILQGVSDSRTGVVLLRPMREFVDKEVAYLAHFLSIDSLCIPTLSSKVPFTNLSGSINIYI